MRTRHFFVYVGLWIFTSVAPTQASFTFSFDFIDDILSPSSGTSLSVPGSYDVVNNSDGTMTPDGHTDFVVSSTVTGTGNDGNNVEWGTRLDVTSTGLRSTIDPSFFSSGGVTTNNSGHRTSQTVQIDFGPGIEVLSDTGVESFGWSSGNTAGVVWEYSILQYLDENGMPFTAAPTVTAQLSHVGSEINGLVGPGTWIADATGTVTMVGFDLTVAGSHGSNNSLNTDSSLTTSMIPLGTRLGGVRMIHVVEDTRGRNNGDTSFTNTINELNMNFQSVPEPAAGMLATLGLFAIRLLVMRRRSSVMVRADTD